VPPFEKDQAGQFAQETCDKNDTDRRWLPKARNQPITSTQGCSPWWIGAPLKAMPCFSVLLGCTKSSETLPLCIFDMTTTDQVQPVQSILATSQFWLGLGVTPPVKKIANLLSEPIYQALQSGHECHVGGWVLRCTPPRIMFNQDGKEMMMTSLVVSSSHAFTTYTPVSKEAVDAACRFIESRDRRELARAGDDDTWES